MKNLFVFCISFLLSFSGAGAESIDQILDKADKLYRSDSSWAKLEMAIATENWTRTLKMEMWTKGLDRTLIRILSPKKDSGISTLKRGKLMWNFFPKINKVIKVPPSMMMGSWMGSDFTNDDLVKESTYKSSYDYKFLDGKDKVYYNIELIPKKETVSVWSKIHLKIEKKRLILIEQVSYNERGERARTMSFEDIKLIGGKVIPTVMRLVSHKNKSSSTIIKYLEASFDKPISDKKFRRQELQRRR